MESNLTEEELAHSDNMLQGDWQKEFDYAGGFQTLLMKTIMYADDVNLKKLGIVYPGLVGAFKIDTKKKKEGGMSDMALKPPATKDDNFELVERVFTREGALKS